MENNKFTLYRLLSEYEVRIPIVQRDYAHGRESKEDIRKHLLDDIFSALEKGEEKDFNHIYGNHETGVFFPVDGQQRLTSLYLLHWYLECKGEVADKRITACNAFTYMTRNSARAFFRMLKERKQEVMDCIRTSISGNEFIRKIKNLPLFSLNWGKDPTVQGALQFLADLINRRLTKETAAGYYEKLVAEDKPIISFALITEESSNSEIVVANKYIRMNARGKKLTDFEKLKALIDGIETKCVKAKNDPGIPGIKLISNYESTYSNVFFQVAEGTDFVAKTEWIDSKSFLLFQSMYNIYERIISGQASTTSDRKEYRERIYSLSREAADCYEYLVLLKAVLEYQKENGLVDFLKDKSETGFSWQERIVTVYIYCYYQKHQTVSGIDRATLEFILKNLYVLRNKVDLPFKEGGALTFAGLLAEEENLWEALSATDENTLRACFNDSAQDIKCRIHELYLMKDIIEGTKDTENPLDMEYFKEYYENCNNTSRKLQAFFYMAGYWEPSQNKELDKLQRYLKASMTVMDSRCLTDWKICYAAGQVCKLTACQNDAFDTNKANACVEQVKTWSGTEYFWSDRDDETKAYREKLVCLQAVYDMVLNLYDELGQTQQESDLKNAVGLLEGKITDSRNWLYYPVRKLYCPELLLQKKLFYDGTTVVIDAKDSRRAFVLYATLLMYAEVRKNKWGYSYEFQNDNDTLDITSKIKQIKLMFQRPSLCVSAEHGVRFAGRYKYQRRNGLPYYSQNDYNMTLLYVRKVPLAENKQENDTYYGYAYDRAEDKLSVFSYRPGRLEKHTIEVKNCEKERSNAVLIKQVMNQNFNFINEINTEKCFEAKDNYLPVKVEFEGKQYQYSFEQYYRQRRLSKIN